jgi:hypothetical protein
MSRYVRSLASGILPRPSFTCAARARVLWIATLLLVLGACGSGGGSSAGTPPPVTTPPSDLQYPVAPTFVVGTAITALTPTVVGEVASYSVSPALPAGLSLSATSGVISGTPTSAVAKTSYTVEATNAGGSTTATVSIVVTNTPTSAPYDLKYPTPPTFVVNTAITPLTPTVVGTVTSYSVSPALPAGLTLSTSSGVISGVPTSVTAAANYTVRASNAAGYTTFGVSIAVVGAPSIAYSSYYSFTANIAAQTISPIVSGAPVTSWAISPALSAGLVFDTTKGTISGTPTVAAAPSIYTVTGSNSAGQSKTAVTLAVAAAPLLDLGHASAVDLIKYANSSLISLDEAGHWELQAYGSGTILASGDSDFACDNCTYPSAYSSYPPIDVAGTTAIDSSSSGIEVRSAVSGQLLTTIPGQFSWSELASDGSYIATGTTEALTVWSTAGTALLTFAGDYSKAIAFSAPGQVQVALGPAGPSVTQTILLPSGSSSVSPTFQGAFTAWFLDGNGFLTRYGNTIWVYSSAAVQQNVVTVTAQGPAGGEGRFFWILSEGSLDIYQVGGSASPVVTTTAYYAVPSGMTLGVFGVNENQLVVIDLSGATPVSTNYTLPPAVSYPTAYAATSASSWVVGDENGITVDGASLGAQPRYLALGHAIIAAGTNYFSVATASGEILYFDSKTDAMLGTVDLQSPSPGTVPTQLSTSTDGTVLAVAVGATPFQGYPLPATNVDVYSLPSGTLVNTFSGVDTLPGGGFSFDMSLSGSGNVIAWTAYESSSACPAQAIAVTGGTPIWCAPTAVPTGPTTVQLSPDGTLLAISAGPALSGTTTSIFPISAPTSAVTVSGWVVGWLDNARLLAEQFATLTTPPSGPGGGQSYLAYEGADIFSSSGANLGSAPIPQIQNFQVVSGDSIYSPQTNTIVSLTTGAPSWISGDAYCYGCDIIAYPAVTTGAITGSQVIFALGHLVLSQPY